MQVVDEAAFNDEYYPQEIRNGNEFLQDPNENFIPNDEVEQLIFGKDLETKFDPTLDEEEL